MLSPGPFLIIYIFLPGLLLIFFADVLIEFAQCQFENEVNVEKKINISWPLICQAPY